MAEYIERETAIAWFMPYAHAGESIDADVVISDIKGMKTADVAQVRRGRWLYEPKFGSTRPYHCSLPDCGASFPGKFLCCPNCGARMDKETDL